MSKPSFIRPTIIMLYGFPGAGKSYVARQLAETLGAAHVHDDRLRAELFEDPQYDRHENEVVSGLMQYMAETFLQAGISVIYDTNVMRLSQRRELRELARRLKAEPLLVWLQIDIESAFARVVKRDRRKIDDKYSAPMDRTTFEQLTGGMQNPQAVEDYVVVSGKHTFTTQKNMIMRKLRDKGLVSLSRPDGEVVKPELVNRIPNPLAGRVDPSRRNIIIR